jgi:catechol 2,3-dioxygenase-like lactoylglutathione lyase family enzyme
MQGTVLRLKSLALALGAASVALASPAMAGAAVGPPQAGASADAVGGVMIHVSELPRSLKFYEGGLGMQVMLTKGEETILGFGSNPAQTAIILLGGASVSSPPRPIVHGTGYARMVLRLHDLPAVARRLRSGGFTVGEIREVTDGYRMMMATDPDGYTFELVERFAGQEKAP